MKILIIHGSPRRGNTWNIVNRVREKINKEIDVNYEIIELSKMKIPMCTGCFNCILKSEEKCPHYESIKYINNKIDWCDAMIITSPVYSLQVSGQLKNFLDHMSYNFHRPKYFNKKALIITTTAGVNAKEISNYINEVLTFWGINTTYKLPIVYRDNNLEKYDKQIDKVLSKFIDTLKNEKLTFMEALPNAINDAIKLLLFMLGSITFFMFFSKLITSTLHLNNFYRLR